MNHYPHHIGDYAEATSHLSFVEDAAYSRLIRKYYSQEKPLPTDLKSVQRLVGARTKEEREAVKTVLEEFFHLEDDGWHNRRCDQELRAYLEGEPEREAKKENERIRLQRHREERATLFARINAAGVHADWNIKMADLRALVQRHCTTAETATETPAETPPDTGTCNAPATAPATPATATNSHKPITNSHKPGVNLEARSPSGSRLTLNSLPPEWQGYCQRERPDLDPERVWQDFHDYWTAKAGKDARKLDWDATWRMWVRKQRAASSSAHAGGQTSLEARNAAVIENWTPPA